MPMGQTVCVDWFGQHDSVGMTVATRTTSGRTTELPRISWS
jgi:hypothetical protein